MYFQVTHRTTYTYSVPVALGPHRLRMLPRDDGRQRLLEHALTIDPVPAHLCPGVDAWGNRVELAWFDGLTRVLDIQLSMSVATWAPPLPLLPTQAAGLPPVYAGETRALAPYLDPMEEPRVMAAFVEPLLGGEEISLSELLERLNARIHGFYYRGVRLDGPARSPGETIAGHEGVCRDLTVLFMAACRYLGIAARFVSGYQQGDGSRTQRYLHAWPEVYLPGLGWRGYDPTHDGPVGDRHLAVAAAGLPADTTPVEGGYSFQGERLTSTLEADIRISGL